MKESTRQYAPWSEDTDELPVMSKAQIKAAVERLRPMIEHPEDYGPGPEDEQEHLPRHRENVR